jgi:hypothetical protein
MGDAHKLSIQIHIPPVVGVGAVEHLDEGGLPRPVFTHEAVKLPFAQLEIHVIERLHAGKFLGDLFRFQQYVFHGNPLL